MLCSKSIFSFLSSPIPYAPYASLRLCGEASSRPAEPPVNESKNQEYGLVSLK